MGRPWESDGRAVRETPPRVLGVKRRALVVLVVWVAMSLAVRLAPQRPPLGFVSPGRPAPGVRSSGSLRGRIVTVRVAGPRTGTVSVTYTAVSRGRVVASGSRLVRLRDGRATVEFRLSARVASRVAVRGTAVLLPFGYTQPV